MHKKQKLLASICVPAAALGAAAGVAAIFLNNNSTKPTTGDYKVSFFADDSSHFVDDSSREVNVYAQTPLDRIDQPMVQSYRPHYLFAGWKDENGDLVPGQKKIVRDTKLTATFGDTTTGDYQTITFKTKSSQPNVKLHGNVSVAVKKGYLFLMINRPSAEWDDNYFEGWQYIDSTTGEYVDMSENTEITTDLTLYPKFTEAVTMTWDAGEGGRILRGSSTTKLASGTVFGKFNQPQLVNDDLNKVFKEWQKSDGTKWDESTKVTEDSTAIAEWVDGTIVQDKYHLLQFDQNYDTGAKVTVYFSPSASTIVEPGTIWGKATKPTVYTDPTDYELDYWQFKNGDTWETLGEDHEFTSAGVTTHIRPVMKSSISGISISGKDEVLPESETTYTAVVAGSSSNPSVSQTKTWELYGDKECSTKVESSVAELDSNGKLTVKSITEATTLYIKVTSTVRSDLSAVQPVTVNMPYKDSQRIWYHNGKQWFSISQKDGICDGSKTSVTATALNSSYGSSTDTIVKSTDFKYKLYIGRQLNTLYSQFGYNWTGFNGEIDLGNVKIIQGSFLENCTSFNQKLDLSNVTRIEGNFLASCTSFDSAITFGEKLEYIGKNFLADCTKFDTAITLPTKADLTIDDGFMYYCSAFNQPFTIPSNVIEIDDFFMYGCNAFTSTLTVEADPSKVMVDNIYTVASDYSGAYIYTLGFSVDGTYANTFTTMFPTYHDDYSYRTIKTGTVAGVKVTADTFKSALAKILFEDDVSTMNFTAEAASVFGGTLYMAYDSTTGRVNAYNSKKGTFERSASSTTTGSPYDCRYSYIQYDSEGKMESLNRGEASCYGRVWCMAQDIANHKLDVGWVYDSSTGKYNLENDESYYIITEGTPMAIGSAQLEFGGTTADPYLKMLTLILDKTKPETSAATITFTDYGTTKVTVPASGYTDYNWNRVAKTSDSVLESVFNFEYSTELSKMFAIIDFDGIAPTLYNGAYTFDIQVSLDDGVNYQDYDLSTTNYMVTQRGLRRSGDFSTAMVENAAGKKCRLTITPDDETITLLSTDGIVLYISTTNIDPTAGDKVKFKLTMVTA